MERRMASIVNVRREGKGRVTPGPSSLRAWGGPVLLALALATGAALQFALSMEARRTASAELLAAVIAAGAAIVLLVLASRGERKEPAAWPTRILAFAAGAAGLFGAPYAVLLNRYSDAPAGSEILFLTSAGWAVILVALTVSRSARDLALASGGLLVLGGVAGSVGNWERPSSFSPFVRYVAEEWWMLAAGVAWALLWWLLGRSSKEGAAAVAVPAAVGGITAAAVAIVASRDTLTEGLSGGLSSLPLLALASAIAVAAAYALLVRSGPRAVAGAFAMQAAVLTSLTWIEQATGAFGPQPILIVPAFAGAAVALAGAVVWSAPLEPLAENTSTRWTTCVAWAAVLSAGVGLARPVLEAHVVGLRSGGESFDARFVLSGAEAVGPWLALGIALGVAAMLHSRDASLWRSAAVLAACLAWPLVAWTPLHTLTTFIPSEVQVDFGSEFASIDFTSLPAPFSYAALGGAVFALLAARVRHSGRLRVESSLTGEG
jgi:hypothetical protein